MKILSVYLLVFVSTISCFSQNAKKLYKIGEKFKLVKEYNTAIEQYSNALKLDPQFAEAYISRAECYERMDSTKLALSDYRKLKALKIKNKYLYYHLNAANICYKLELYDEAIENLTKIQTITKLKHKVYTLKAKIFIAQKEYIKAIQAANIAIQLEDNSQLHFLKATAYEKSNNLDNAEKEYIASISRNSSNIKALIAIGYLQLRMSKMNYAFKTANQIINIDQNNKDGYYIRSQVYENKKDYPNAINDISQTIMLSPDDKDLYFTRGTYYQNFTQHQNAINDFSKAILLDDSFALAFSKRAFSYEQIANYSKAITDYNKLLELSADDENAKALMEQAQKKLYDLNKEDNKPQIVVIDPQPDNKGNINIPKNIAIVNLKGLIIDESNISSIQINSVNVDFTKNENDVKFDAKINTYDADSIYIIATDIYNNKQETVYSITRTEIDPPFVSLLNPYASDNNEVFTEQNSQNMFVEGSITDESLINSISIGGVQASFKMDEQNPKFLATINIANKNSFTITAKDIHGNETNQIYIINRSGIKLSENNPMGRTWAIFIENSDYDNFPSLDGPERDVSLMRSALINYEIHNIIHKKNLAKKDLEKFFAIDLRDLIKNNGVRSLLIWYAGHGKFINETGYWIPIDATREDEFSYFSTNTLKAALQSYNNLLDHTLLITDACESGPTFYQAMRGEPQERNCGDWESTKLKSSQIFTSAGYELAIDNSQFTKTFANMLANNPNTCIPIEKIVTKVKETVTQNNQQKPQFGKIAGLEDENGTFFFINKQ